MTPAIRAAWLQRVIDRAFPNPPATLGDVVGREMVCNRIMEEARKRDPMLDPRVGDVILLPEWSGIRFVRCHILRRIMAVPRGNKGAFQPKREHVIVVMRTAEGEDIRRNSRTFTLTGLQTLLASDGCVVLDCAR